MSSLKPVRGTHDLFATEMQKYNFIVDMGRNIAFRYGCQEVATPIFEFSQVFKRTLGDASDIVNKEMYSFMDKGDEELTLRPEGTAGIARAFVSNGWAQVTPLKLFYHGPMFRYERPQKGRQRQFHQLGAEFIGVSSSVADIEIVSMAQNFIQQLGIDQFTLEINSLGDPESRETYRDKLVQYLNPYSEKLSKDSQRRLQQNPLRVLDSKDEQDKEIVAGAPKLEDHLNEVSQKIFNEVKAGLTEIGIDFVENPQLVRGLDYYCHCVFEFKSKNLGAQDTILSGGRYDGLIEMMGGKPTPAVGFAAGIERLMLLMNKEIAPTRPFALIPLGEEAENKCVALCHELRTQGLNIEMAYSGNMSKRMKKANAWQARAAIIIGQDEIQQGEATVKDLDSGAQVKMKIENLGQQLKNYVSTN